MLVEMWNTLEVYCVWSRSSLAVIPAAQGVYVDNVCVVPQPCWTAAAQISRTERKCLMPSATFCRRSVTRMKMTSGKSASRCSTHSSCKRADTDLFRMFVFCLKMLHRHREDNEERLMMMFICMSRLYCFSVPFAKGIMQIKYPADFGQLAWGM